MPKNIEIKARVNDFAALKNLAEQISDTPVELLIQEDTFFETAQGRLKLRVFDATRGELILYSRADTPTAKTSTYLIARTSEPETLKTILSTVLPVRGVVRKCRWLYLAGQTRIHLDEVENLGHFVELEFVMRDDQTMVEGERTTQALMEKLAINQEDLIAVAYIDLLSQPNLQ
ncbi:MAG: class IV adenylate cyclase [Acidobacteriota bacterium]